MVVLVLEVLSAFARLEGKRVISGLLILRWRVLKPLIRTFEEALSVNTKKIGGF